MKAYMHKQNLVSRGFSIVELIVVIIVVAILATLAVVGYNGIQQNARDNSLLSDIDAVEAELTRYATKNGGVYDSVLNWDSSVGSNANISFTPSQGNIINVSSYANQYCVRGYNPKSSYYSLSTASEAWSERYACYPSNFSPGHNNLCGIESGQVKCLGWNMVGQIGNGSTTDSVTAVNISTTGLLSGKVANTVAFGPNTGCAVVSSGYLYCWGSGTSGQLGNGINSSSPVPVAVVMDGALEGKTVKSVAIGQTHTCVIASDDKAYCWGAGTDGRLGNNGTASSPVPVAVNTSGVLAGKTIKAISGSGHHMCVLDIDGKAYCWGKNNVGQLGTGTTSALSPVPVAVITSGVLNGKELRSITGSMEFSCTVSYDNKAYCWGSGSYGRLGNGASASSSQPVLVTQFSL